MKIAVIGLGLIGGSICKAVKANTSEECFGFDIDETACESAVRDGAVDGILAMEDLYKFDLTIVCLHPKQTIDFIRKNAVHFKKGSVVCDICGVKSAVVLAVEPCLKLLDVHFVPCHPMAGREFSGYDYSKADLFCGASFIIAKTENTKLSAIELMRYFARKIGFAKVVITTPKVHDATIAYTSQLVHVVSNCYVKSKTLQNESGFSAGSFRDLTRVAKLNENMWTDLFLMNADALQAEITTLINSLQQVESAIETRDSDKLKQLLRDGRILKENCET